VLLLRDYDVMLGTLCNDVTSCNGSGTKHKCEFKGDQVEANLSKFGGQPLNPAEMTLLTAGRPSVPRPASAHSSRPSPNTMSQPVCQFDGSDISCVLSLVLASQIIGRRLLCSVMVERGSPEIRIVG
jgi:hypothetical protein